MVQATAGRGQSAQGLMSRTPHDQALGVCVCVCILCILLRFIRTNTHTHTHTLLRCARTHVTYPTCPGSRYLHLHKQCIYVHVYYVCIYHRMQTDRQTYVYTYMHAYIHTYIHTYIHIVFAAIKLNHYIFQCALLRFSNLNRLRFSFRTHVLNRCIFYLNRCGFQLEPFFDSNRCGFPFLEPRLLLCLLLKKKHHFPFPRA